MRLVDVLSPEGVFVDLKAMDKFSVLEEIIGAVIPFLTGVARESVQRAIFEREKLGSTGIGYGVALPHGRVKGLSEIKVFFGRSVRGVDYQSMDRARVHLFFVILSPESSTSSHLKILAIVSNLLKNPDFRGNLLRAADAAGIYAVIAEADRKNVLA